MAGAKFREHCWPLFINLQTQSAIKIYVFTLLIFKLQSVINVIFLPDFLYFETS